MDRTALAHQVSTPLGDHIEDYDIDAIVGDLIDAHGPIETIDDVDSDAYWDVVRKHDRTTTTTKHVMQGTDPIKARHLRAGE